MHAVATGAIGHDSRASPRGQTVVARQIRRNPVPLKTEFLGELHALVTMRARQIPRRYLGSGVVMRLDGMDAVAIGANRRLPVSARDGLAVNALLELPLDRAMALAAGIGNVEFEYRRLGVSRGQDVVRAVAIGTDCCLLHAFGHGLAMNALLVGNKGLGAAAGGFHDKLLAMASATGGGNIGVIGP